MTTSNIQGLRASFTRDEYISPVVYDKEMHEVFAANWCHVGQSYQLSHIGDRLVAQVGNESILIVRNRENELRAYFNVCQHRGSQLCDESGSGYGAAISCPYHAWTYSLNGKLVGAIHHDQESFDRECISLKQVHVGEWQGNLFVNINEQAPSLDEWLE
jgi:Rieske 2Fe-2S family protein